MSKAILLVTNNLEVVDTFRRITQGHGLGMEVVSSVSDAVMAYIQSMHHLVFLSPGVEGGRGIYLVKELASLSPRIVLLGERREGFVCLEFPLVEPEVLACLDLEEEEVETSIPIVIFNEKEPPTFSFSKGVVAKTTKATPMPEKAPVSNKTKGGDESASSKNEGILREEAAFLRAQISRLSEQLAVVSEEKAQAKERLQQMEKSFAQLERKLQMQAKLEAELRKNQAEKAQLNAQKEATFQTEQEMKLQRELFQKEKEHAQEEVKKMEFLLERALEERTLWQENRAELMLEIQQTKASLAQTQEEKDMACLQLAEVNEKWKESDSRLHSAASTASISQAEIDALKASAEQAEVAFKAELEQQALSSQKRIEEMEEELVRLRSQVANSEAEVRAALAMAPATRILPLSSPMPGNVFSSLEECLQLLGQTVAVRPWLRLDVENPLGRRKLYIHEGSLVGVDSNCPGDVLLRQAQRDGFISSKQYQNLRLLEERSPEEQREVLLQKGFVREVEVDGLLQRYAERVVMEALSQGEAAFALAEEEPGADVTVLKKPQPFWPLLKKAVEHGHREAGFLERFGGRDAIPVLKSGLAGLVAMGMGKRETRFFESVDGETRLEEFMGDLGFRPQHMVSMLLTAWKMGVLEFSKRPFAHAGASEVSTERLFARFEEIRDADYFDVLGVSQEASTCELEEAHMRLMEEFNPLKFAGHRNPQAFACAEQLAALVEEAFGALENEAQRREYAHHLMGNG